MATKNGLVLIKKSTGLLREHIRAHMHKIEKDLCGTNFTKKLVPHRSFSFLYMYSRICARRSPVDFFFRGREEAAFQMTVHRRKEGIEKNDRLHVLRNFVIYWNMVFKTSTDRKTWQKRPRTSKEPVGNT